MSNVIFRSDLSRAFSETQNRNPMRFRKYEGIGNDFIVLDHRTTKEKINEVLIQNMCHRRKGIGADGVVVLEPDFSADCLMR